MTTNERICTSTSIGFQMPDLLSEVSASGISEQFRRKCRCQVFVMAGGCVADGAFLTGHEGGAGYRTPRHDAGFAIVPYQAVMGNENES
ncbi:MAG: hypothetical protein Greene041619_34 [Candidatus Peregrinibacteria bacterium Greene0416_19]|nr:MAG: hypothetical protein Greene041619_34 [Candidatus Peregrinibacteria bacterium Greene0416_19]